MRIARLHLLATLLALGAVAAVVWGFWHGRATRVTPAAGGDPSPAFEVNGRRFAGVAACEECHAERVASYRQTAHHLSMQWPAAGKLDGLLPAKIATHEPHISYEAAGAGDHIDVTSFGDQSGHGQEHKRTERAVLVLGSGKLSHSLLFRRDNALYQTPIFFFAPLGEWMPVPGFLDLMPYWGQAITPRCLDCHTTYFDHLAGTRNSYRYDNAIVGISCERCHGRGSEHVEFHRAHRDATEAHAIVMPQTLSRERQLDVCGQCHGEVGNLKRPAFTYTPGEPLDEYLEAVDRSAESSLGHSADELQRLQVSKCFQKSDSMTCTTCHDPHEVERADLRAHSQRCQQCHDASAHPEAADIGPLLAENCIDCHMPKRDDKVMPIKIATGERVELMQLRDHYIGVYLAQSQDMRKQWQQPDARLEADSAPPVVARRRMALAWVRKAQAASATGQSDAVRAALDTALRYDPQNSVALVALAGVFVSQGRYEDAIARARAALAGNPQDTAALSTLAYGLMQSGQFAECADCYRELLKLVPDSRDALNNLAWLLATHPDAGLRNGTEAVALAERLCGLPGGANWSQLDTLAAAYAEAGQFERAVEVATRALDGCRTATPPNPAKVEAIGQRLESYRRREAFRDAKSFGKPTS